MNLNERLSEFEVLLVELKSEREAFKTHIKDICIQRDDIQEKIRKLDWQIEGIYDEIEDLKRYKELKVKYEQSN